MIFAEVTSIASSHPILNQDPSEFIPEIVKTLDDEDPVIVKEALLLLERTVKKDHFVHGFYSAMVRSRPLIHAIVNAMNKAYTIMVQSDGVDTNEAKCALEAAEKRARIATDILRTMANRNERTENLIACEGIVSVGGIFALTLLLPSHLERIKYNSVVTIHTVLLAHQGRERHGLLYEAKKQFRDAKGIQVMVDLLENAGNNVKLLAVVCDCLYYVETGDKRSKQIILSEKGTERAMKILKKAKYPNLVEKALKMLQGKRKMFQVHTYFLEDVVI